MANEVMIALDGSEKGDRALPVALALAALADASVHLVHVIQPVSARIANQAQLIGVDPLNAAGRSDAEKQLGSTARRLTMISRRPVSWSVLEGADVARVLVATAKSRDVTAVVMGTRGATTFGLAIVGSVADRVIRECARPVVIVPPHAANTEARPEICRILVPLDGSPLAARSVDYLLELPSIRKTDVMLVEVVHNQFDILPTKQRLLDVAARFRDHAVNASSHVFVHGDTVRAIATAARELMVDMIAMSTRGEGGLQRFVLGSVAEGVVRVADVPVLLLTPTMLSIDSRRPRLSLGAAERGG